MFDISKLSVLNNIVVVTGLPRSGTSMMMKMLEAGGIPLLTDGERKADIDNPKGYYEFEKVKHLRTGDVSWLPSARGKAVKVISYLLPFLPGAFEYTVIAIRREISEIIASQEKMLRHRDENPSQISPDKLAGLLKKNISDAIDWASRQKNIRLLEVEHNYLMTDFSRAIIEIDQVFERQLDLMKMESVIDPGLYRNVHKRPHP